MSLALPPSLQSLASGVDAGVLEKLRGALQAQDKHNASVVQGLSQALVTGGSLRVFRPYTVTSPLVLPSDWHTPTLTNGWVNYGGGRPVAAYRKDSLGTVWLSGEVKSGSVGAFAAFTLPVGFRPDVDQRLPCYTGGGTPRDGLLQANTNGDVQLYFVDNAEVALSTSFPCADRSPGVPSCFPFDVVWPNANPPTFVAAQCADTASGTNPSNLALALPDWTYISKGSSNLLHVRNIPGLLQSKNYAVTLVAF